MQDVRRGLGGVQPCGYGDRRAAIELKAAPSHLAELTPRRRGVDEAGPRHTLAIEPEPGHVRLGLDRDDTTTMARGVDERASDVGPVGLLHPVRVEVVDGVQRVE